MGFCLVQEVGRRSKDLVGHSLLFVDTFEESSLLTDPTLGADGVQLELGTHSLKYRD